MKNSKHLRLLHNLNSLSTKEIIMFGLEGALIICVLGYFFFRSVPITVICSPLILIYILYKAEKTKGARRLELQTQFKEVLISVNGSIRAGYSIENAFLEAEKEMIVFYGSQSNIAKELSILRLGIKNGKSISQLLMEMGKRNEVQSIKDFASILVIGKQTGGNITDIIDTFIHIEEDRVQVNQEIATMISSQRYEQKIMNCVPFFIIFYIEITNKGFFDILYNNILGRAVMVVCLVLYVFAIYMSERIIDIKL